MDEATAGVCDDQVLGADDAAAVGGPARHVGLGGRVAGAGGALAAAEGAAVQQEGVAQAEPEGPRRADPPLARHLDVEPARRDRQRSIRQRPLIRRDDVHREPRPHRRGPLVPGHHGPQPAPQRHRGPQPADAPGPGDPPELRGVELRHQPRQPRRRADPHGAPDHEAPPPERAQPLAPRRIPRALHFFLRPRRNVQPGGATARGGRGHFGRDRGRTIQASTS